jgi:hypothetical protein
MPTRDFNARVPTMTDTASAAHTHSTRLRSMAVADCTLRPLVMATITRLSSAAQSVCHRTVMLSSAKESDRRLCVGPRLCINNEARLRRDVQIECTFPSVLRSSVAQLGMLAVNGGSGRRARAVWCAACSLIGAQRCLHVSTHAPR